MRLEGELGMKEPCPCGRGKLYKNCCRRNGVKFLRDKDGSLVKKIPMNDEVSDALKRQMGKREAELGRPLRPDDRIFPEAAEAFPQIRKAMQEIGIPPEKIYAFEKTGRIVTEENMKFLSAADLKEWQDAIDEYLKKSKLGSN